MACDDAGEPALESSIPFTCDVCQARFLSRNTLFRHLREQHTSVKKLPEPPSARWEAEHPSAPEVHAKATAVVRKAKDKKEMGGAREEPKKLQIETRPEAYDEELRQKVADMEALLDGFGSLPLPATEVFASPPEHFRMRVEFDISHSADGPSYVMHVGKERVAVPEYPMGCRQISDAIMPTVLKALQDNLVLRQQLFQINFHATLYGDAMVSLLYRTPYGRSERRERMLKQGEMRQSDCQVADDSKLTAEWEDAAVRLSESLSGASIIGRTRGRKRVVGRAWVQEQFQVVGCPAVLRYRQLEGFFSQSNASVCQHMLAWARAVAYADGAELARSTGSPRDDDLLELYCGNGNFCVALAPLLRKTFATEMVKELLDTARTNAEENGVGNIDFGRVSAEELALAMDGARAFTRLEHVDLKNYDFQTVLVDPPRAGLGPAVATFLSGFRRIVYVSCNPKTLQEDLHVLCKTHDIRRLAAFDQFAYTDHLEMGILLVRRF